MNRDPQFQPAHVGMTRAIAIPTKAGRIPPKVVLAHAADMVVTAGGPRPNTDELRGDFFGAEHAGWARARCTVVDTCAALRGEPYARWA